MAAPSTVGGPQGGPSLADASGYDKTFRPTMRSCVSIDSSAARKAGRPSLTLRAMMKKLRTLIGPQQAMGQAE